MLKVYNKEHILLDALTELKDYKIEYLLSGEDLAEFSLSRFDEKATLLEEEGYVRNEQNEYVIKEIDPSDNFNRYTCVINLENIKGKSISSFITNNNNITDTIRLAISGTGWTLAGNAISKKRTIKLKNTNALEVLREVRKVFRVDFRYDAINKIIYVYESFGSDKGIYFSDELNLITLSTPSESYNYITKIIPKGKDGITINAVNGGKNYIENYQYSNKIIEYIWEDNRYTDANSLKEDAEAKLNELSKPKRNYIAKVYDLAKNNDEYSFLDFFLGDTVTIISNLEKFRFKQRIIKYTKYPDDPANNTCELGNTTLTFEDIQRENEYKNQVVDNITSDNGTIDGSKVDGITTEQIYDFEASVGKITDLTVINAEIENLKATNVTITGELNAVKANVGTLTANVATIDNLTVTHTAQINDLKANSATITQLEAVNANIDNLEVEVGKINTLLAGNLTAENIQAGSITAREIATGSITAGSGIIAEGAIGSAQISELNANKIDAGTIDTSMVTIAGPNSNLRLRGNRLQVFTGIGSNQVERVSLGDVLGDGSRYGLLIRGSDGKTILMDENGVTNAGVTNGSITNDKISGDANIDGAKLNINSVVTKINGATTSIFGTKIDINGTNLSAKLSQQDTTITEHKKITDSHTTSITANTNAIKLKVDTQTYTTDKTNMTNTLNKNTADISLLNSQILLKVEQADITNAIKGIEIGSRNLVSDSKINQTSNKYGFGRRVVIGGLENNTTYTFSVNGRSNPNGNVDNKRLVCYVYETSWNYGSWSFAIADTIDTTKNLTFTTGSNIKDKTVGVSFYWYPNGGDMTGDATVNWCKLEKGNKATDWTPAPEDVDDNIDTKVSTAKAEIKITTDAITQNVSNLTTTVNNKADGSTVTTLSNKVGSLETSVNGISGKVSSLETTTTTLRNDVNTANTNANKGINDAKTAQDTANTNKGNITNLTTEVTTVKSNVASLDVNLQGITQRVSSTETNITTVTTIANNALTNANNANNKIDGLEVGGRNLLLNTSFTDRSNWYSNGGTFTIENEPSSSSGKCLKGVAPASGKGIYQHYTPKVLGKYTISFYGKADNTLNIYIGQEGSTTKDLTLTTSWQKFTYTFDRTSLNKNAYVFYPKASGTFYIHSIKVEKGTKTTDWTPAPEDIQSQIDTTATEIATTKSKIATIETNLSSITSRVSTVETTQTTVNGKVTALETWKKEAEVKITDASIISTVSSQFYKKGETDAKYATQSQITQLDNKINLKVSSANLLSEINIKTTGIDINADDVTVRGVFNTYNRNNPSSRYMTVADGFLHLYKNTSASKPSMSLGYWGQRGTVPYISIARDNAWETSASGMLYMTSNEDDYSEDYRLEYARLSRDGQNTIMRSNVHFRTDGTVGYNSFVDQKSASNKYSHEFDGGIKTVGDFIGNEARLVNLVGKNTALGIWAQGNFGGVAMDSGIGHFMPLYDNKLACGHPGFRWSTIHLINSPTITSDIRAKENIKYVPNSSETNETTSIDMYNFIKDRLKIAQYDYKCNPEERVGLEHAINFIAQDLLNDKVGELIINRDVGEYLSYNMQTYISVLAAALQVALKKIEVLESRA